MEETYTKQRIKSVKHFFSLRNLTLALLFMSALNTSKVFAQSPLCESYATSQCCEWVTRVMMNGSEMTMPTTTPTYMDYTGTPLTTVTAGTSFNIEVEVTTNSTYLEYVYIWFDMNQDDVIQDPAELMYTGNQTFNGVYTYTSTVSVPTTAYNGHIYARVLMSYNALPVLCGTYSYGNTFDFLINVVGGTPNPVNNTLTVTKSGSGTGEITSNPSGINTAIGVYSFDFPDNEVVTLTATPSGASNFAGWSGDASGTNQNVTITLDNDKTCNAIFNGPIISSQPTDKLDNCPGSDVTFNISASGTNINYQWKKDGSNIGTNTNSLSLTNIDSGDEGSYSCVVTCDEGTETSNTVTLSVDGIDPTVTTTNFTVNLDGDGNANITTSDINNGSTDNCGINTISLDITAFTCANIGTNTVNLTVTDIAGNSATAPAIVTVNDVTNPDIPVLADVTGECSATASVPTTTDNCSVTVTGTTSDALTYTTQGTHVITWNFDDGNGNDIDVTQNVIITDVTNPTIVCTGNQTIFLAVGETSYTVSGNEFDPSSVNDNCGIASVENDYNLTATLAGEVLAAGSHTFVWTVTDVGGNTNTCSVTITFKQASPGNALDLDGIDDYVDCGNNASLDITGTALTIESWIYPTDFKSGSQMNTIVGKDYWTGPSDEKGYAFRYGGIGGDLSFVCSDGIDWFDVIANNVLSLNNWQHVAIIYNGTTVKLYVNGVEVASSNYSSPIASSPNNLMIGRCPNEPVIRDMKGQIDELRIWDNARTDCDIQGYMNTELAGDEANLVAYYNFNEGIAGGNNVGVTTLPDLTVNGNNGTLNNFLLSGNNSNWVESFADLSGTIVFSDITPPVTPTLANVTGECTATASVPTTTDNCAGTITGTTSDALTYTTEGTHVITWNFDDGNGNNINVTQNVIIDDVTDPVADALSLIDIHAECSVNSLSSPTATDNCSGTVTVTHNASLPITNQGTTVVLWTYNDGNGNTASQTQNVIIDDVTNPDNPVLANVTGECTATASVPTTTDNCSGTVTGTTSDALTYTAQGTHVITWNFDDGNGNAINVTQNVIIDDVTNPDTPVLADVTGECTATASVPTTTDNCSGTVTGTTSDAITYTAQGTHVITWNFDDGNGNAINVTQNVIIDDITNPDTPVLANVTGECTATASVPTTTDNCSGTVTGTTSDALTYTAQGTHVITWNFDDGNGNNIDVTQNVIVDDVTNPDIPVLADVTGECSATAAVPVTTDNCVGTVTGTTSDALTYTAQGTHVITWNFDDGNGNAIDVTQNVIIDDVTNPDTPVLADVTGECTATASVPTTTDNCSVTVTGTTSDALTYTAQGTHVITWNFDDGNGNAIDVTQNVIIDDVTNPDTPVLANVTGECTATASVPTTTDNCSGTVTGTTSDALTYTAQGTHVITWNFDDGNGNNINVTQNVIVDDITNPDTPVLADVTGECTATASVPTTTDNCSGTVTGTTSDALTYTAQGTHVITWNFDDGKGNAIDVTQNVIIDDVTNPDTPVLADVTGECSATASVPTTTDNCSGTVTGTTSDALTYTVQGTHVITWNFDDGNGNAIDVTQNVIIDDITNPDTPVLADVTGECSATASVPTTTDNCSGTLTGTTSDALTYTIQGSYVITWNFDDGNGNNIDVTQNVIVDDVTNPDIPVLANVTGECSATAAVPVTTDNCSGTVTGTTSDPLTYTVQGSYIITWNFDDGNGNNMDVTQNVIVDDVTNPDIPVLADVTGECSATATVPVTTDNCVGTVTGTTSDALTYASQGTHVITWNFDDGNGNNIDVTQNVIVDDITNPDIPVLADVTDECSATATVPVTTDNCEGTVTGTTSDALTYTSQGTHVITWNFDDGNGNSIDVNQNVIIDDITNPIARAQNIVIYLDENGYASISESDINNESSDNCSITDLILDKYEFLCENLGDNTVILSVTDIGGNSATATATVTVKDDISPDITECASDVSITAEVGCETSIPDYTTSLSVADNCTSYEDLLITQTPIQGSIVENGNTEIVFNVFDGSGNETVCRMNFEVICNETLIVPEVFSPNEDGFNDYFIIHGLNEKYPDNQLLIINRWGSKVYEASPYLNNWTGESMFGLSVGGNKLPEGTYFYIIELGEGNKPLKGYIYLKK